MPGLVRKLFIFAAVDGLILQSHGPSDQARILKIDYETRRITEKRSSDSSFDEDEPRLESHGIVGLIQIASLSFLIAITKREQVAQIFGRPIYTITDVAILPLSSRVEASEAITSAVASKSLEAAGSDSDSGENDEDHHSLSEDVVATPFDDRKAFEQRNASGTNIAEDVAKRKGAYGKFASDWLSKQLMTSARTVQQKVSPLTNSTHPDPGVLSSPLSKAGAESETARINVESRHESVSKAELDAPRSGNSSTATTTMSLLPKVLRSTKMILSSRSFFFAYDFDLTRRLSLMSGRPQPPIREQLDPTYFWNRRLGAAFLDVRQDSFLIPIIQGFVGQRSFQVKSAGSSSVSDTDHSVQETDKKGMEEERGSYLLSLISRRSTLRSGLRYLRRGIDDDGNAANFVETEQILSSPTWAPGRPIRSFVQIRGSIPLYFSQTPYAFKPIPVFHNSLSANESAFRKHFQHLRSNYGQVQIALLVDKHGNEITIGEAFEKLYNNLCEAKQLHDVKFEWFDFHAECRGMKFGNVQRLVDKLKQDLDTWGETVFENGQKRKQQTGVIRTNCMDCLDRTNVAESAFGEYILQRGLREEGYDIDLIHDESTNWFNTLWADNGDAISRQYAGSAALKGDFTRTRRRNWRGQVHDLSLTLTRYYGNMVNDYFSQAVIDMMLGNVTWRVFEDFESSMMSADPGISVAAQREGAIDRCAKIVIQEENEDLIHGWMMLSPAQENTLRTLPFEETVVLLTDASIYCCKFDWSTDKVASFEKVDLRSITKIRYGAYVTSTFTKLQLDEALNQGLVILYTPGKGDVIRHNTRSLQTAISTASHSTSLDGGTGLLSWFSPKAASNSTRTMALKVIRQDASLKFDDMENASLEERHEAPHAVAERISEEIRRAVEGPRSIEDRLPLLDEGDIISAEDAKRRTGYLEHLGYSIKRMVWT